MMTRLEAERRRSLSLSVEVRERREPPSIQFVKETSTFLSFFRVEVMFAVVGDA
jgi:hypothetical protein